MKYVRFGPTDLKVSRLCLGGMMFSRKIDVDGTRRVIDEALDAGVNFIDTAESYTDSEDYIGRAVQGRRDKVYLATKVYTHRAAGGDESLGRNSRANIQTSLERSLEQLRTDRVDLYQLHHPDPKTPLDETLQTLDRAVKAGKIRYVGVTNHYSWQMAWMIARAQNLGFDPIISIQCRYNVLDRVVETETVPMATRFGLAMMAYAPLCGGMLTGKYPRGQTTQQGTRSEEDTKLQALLDNDKAFDVIDRLQAIARRENLQLPQLAMLWLMGKPYLTTPILGGSKPEHFRIMYEIADRELSPDVMSEIDAASTPFIHRPFENQPMREGPPLTDGLRA
jgi:aryl-alcohol dehydrogenase-like predicted oxidoreductase